MEYHFVGKFDDAIMTYRKLLEIQPRMLNTRLFLIAVLVEDGRDQEARSEAEEAMKMNPQFSLKDFAQVLPWKQQWEIDRIINALAKVGFK